MNPGCRPEGRELKSHQSLALAFAVENHAQVGLGADQDGARLAVNSQNIADLLVFQFPEDSR